MKRAVKSPKNTDISKLVPSVSVINLLFGLGKNKGNCHSLTLNIKLQECICLSELLFFIFKVNLTRIPNRVE